MKRVSDLIIGTEYDVTLVLNDDGVTLASANVGAINLIDLSTNDVANPAAFGGPLVIAKVCEDSDGNRYFRQSLPIHRGAIQNYSHSAFAVAVPKESTVVLDALTPVTVGTEHTLFITDYNDFNYILGRRRISYVVQTGDDVDDIGDGLAAAITADVSIPNVTAAYTSGSNTLTLTGKAVSGSGNVNNNFRAAHEILFNVHAADGLLGYATVDNAAVLPDPGCGTFREVRKMEETYKGYKGYTNRVIYPTSVNIQYDSASGVDYDLFVIEHKAPQHTNTEGDVHAQVVTTIAQDDSDAALATLVTDLQALVDVM